MTSATLSPRATADHGMAHVLHQGLHTANLLLSALASSRGYVGKVQSADRLLRQSNRFETSQPLRAAALRQAAADQID
jgi:hypothetical protein